MVGISGGDTSSDDDSLGSFNPNRNKNLNIIDGVS
jgi:hypothetical protein